MLLTYLTRVGQKSNVIYCDILLAPMGNGTTGGQTTLDNCKWFSNKISNIPQPPSWHAIRRAGTGSCQSL